MEYGKEMIKTKIGDAPPVMQERVYSDAPYEDWKEIENRFPQRDGTFPVKVHMFDNEEDMQHFAKGGSVGALADTVRRHGRGEDSVLIHVNPEELEQLRGQWGTPTINPHTGLPEFGLLKSIKKIAQVALPIIGGIVGGPLLGTALGGVVGGSAAGAGLGLLGSALLDGGAKSRSLPPATADSLLTDQQKANFNRPLDQVTAAWNPTFTPAQGAALSYDDWIKKLGEGREQQWLNPTFTRTPPTTPTTLIPTQAIAPLQAPTNIPYPGPRPGVGTNIQPVQTYASGPHPGIRMAQGGFVGGQMQQTLQEMPFDSSRMPIPSRNDPNYQQFLNQMMRGSNRPKTGALSEVHMANGGALGYSEGGGSGRDDKIPAKLSNNEYVMDAESVAMLGDGSSDEGAKRLDKMRENLRKHKGAALAKGKFSPDAKPPLSYL